MSEEFDFESIKNKALEQLKSGKPLLGKDGAFAPLLESILSKVELRSRGVDTVTSPIEVCTCFCILPLRRLPLMRSSSER